MQVHPNRFRDSGERLENFADLFLVECPNCSKLCQIRAHPNKQKTDTIEIFQPRRATCAGCGFTREWAATRLTKRECYDWYFGLPLWLQSPCCGEILWAFNAKHLDFLESYFVATIREQKPNVNRSVISRLPLWMKDPKNRNNLLRAVASLRKRLPQD